MENDLLEHLGIGGILVVLLAKEWIVWARNRGNHTIQSRFAALEVRMDKQEAREIPPAWFEREVRDLSDNVKRLSQSCIAMHSRPPLEQ